MLITILWIFVSLIIAIIILAKPYLGIVFIAATLPVTDILPSTPYISSLFPVMGVITLVSFLLQSRYNRHAFGNPFHFSAVHIVGLFLVGWIFISNPQAAWFGGDRNWLLTYIQLLVLTWLAGVLLDFPMKQHVLMAVFSVSSIVSAYIAIQSGNIGQAITLSTRTGGLAEGANTAARYFIVAMVFLFYLRSISSRQLIRILALAGAIIAIFGLFFTVSRTGMVLLVAAFALMVFFQPGLKYRFPILVFFLFLMGAVWLFFDNIVNIAKAILPAVIQGTDTIGLRYALWKAGWSMWLANPIAGVGVGNFANQLHLYSTPQVLGVYFYSGLVAHNMYVAMLAETGLVGFILFILLLIKSLQNFLLAGQGKDPEFLRLRNVWLIVFIIMLLGGITKTDQADKLVWLVMGVSVFFHDQAKIQVHEPFVHKAVVQSDWESPETK